MEIYVNAKLIGIKKPIAVKATQGNVRNSINVLREVTNVQLKQEKMFNEGENLQPQTAMDFFDEQIKLIDTLNDFIADILKLSKKEQKKLEDFSFDELTEFASNIAGELLGMKETEVTEEDLKSDNN